MLVTSLHTTLFKKDTDSALSRICKQKIMNASQIEKNCLKISVCIGIILPCSCEYRAYYHQMQQDVGIQCSIVGSHEPHRMYV